MDVDSKQQQEGTKMVTVVRPSLLDKTKVLKQRLFHPNTALPEKIEDATKTLSNMKTKLQRAQNSLDKSIKIAASVQRIVDAYQKASHQHENISLSKALQAMTASVAIGSQLTIYKTSLVKIKAIEDDIASLKCHRHCMDRYQRKAIKHNQGANNKKIQRTQDQFSQKKAQFESHVQKILNDTRVLSETAKLKHQFENDILASEFQVLHSLRVILSDAHTPEGENLYHKAWKSFAKRMNKL